MICVEWDAAVSKRGGNGKFIPVAVGIENGDVFKLHALRDQPQNLAAHLRSFLKRRQRF